MRTPTRLAQLISSKRRNITQEHVLSEQVRRYGDGFVRHYAAAVSSEWKPFTFVHNDPSRIQMVRKKRTTICI